MTTPASFRATQRARRQRILEQSAAKRSAAVYALAEYMEHVHGMDSDFAQQFGEATLEDIDGDMDEAEVAYADSKFDGGEFSA